MTRRDKPSAWEKGWEDHEMQQLQRLAALPLVQKLEWLEEAQRLVRNLTSTGLTTPSSLREHE